MSARHPPDRPASASFLEPRIAAPFLLTALIWGSTWLVIKGQLGTVPPSWSVTWRFAGASLGMVLLALVRRERLWPGARVVALAAVIGVATFCANFQFVYRSESYLTSGLVAVIFALLLVPNAVLARVLLGQPITRGFLFGSAVAIAGIGLLMLHEYRASPLGANVPLGVGMVLVALACASVGNVLQATPAARSVSAVVLLGWALSFGALADCGLAWVISGPPVIDWSPRYLLSVGYLALFGSVLTFPLYNLLLRELGPGRAAYNGVLVPVVAMGLSTLFEGFRWSPLTIGGAALALTGLVLALRARNPSR